MIKQTFSIAWVPKVLTRLGLGRVGEDRGRRGGTYLGHRTAKKFPFRDAQAGVDPLPFLSPDKMKAFSLALLYLGSAVFFGVDAIKLDIASNFKRK